jgi:hypothetical protein
MAVQMQEQADVKTERGLTPGLYHNVPYDEYRSWPAASQSMLKTIRDKSPAHALWERLHPSEPTPALILGTAVHMAVLQNDLFKRTYTVAPQVDRRTKAGKEAWADFVAANSDKNILTADDYAQCMAIYNSVAHHPIASQLLEGESERSALWQDPMTGVMCKGRFDKEARIGVIADLKTTLDASPEAFTRSIWNYGYYMQGGHYLKGAQTLGLDVHGFVFIAVEKAPPYCVAVYHLTPDAAKAGYDETLQLLEIYQKCQESGVWPGYPEEAVEIGLPSWGWRQVDERLGYTQ